MAGDTGAHGHLTAADYKFLANAAHSGDMQLALGQIGLQKGTDPGVRAFAQRMVDTYQKAGSEATLLATQKGVDLPEIGTIEELNQLNTAKLDGAAFDQALMDCFVTDQKNNAVLFQNEVDAASDSDMKVWAAKMLLITRDNLKLAQDTVANLTVTAAKN